MIVRSRYLSIVALLALPLGLTACGNGASKSDAPVAATARTTSGTPNTSAPRDTSAAPTSRTSSTGPTTSKPPRIAKKIGPAPAGAVIKAGAGTSLPLKIGAWTNYYPPSGAVNSFGNDKMTVSTIFTSGDSFEDGLTNIIKRRTRAGTGFCGEGYGSAALLCYLRTADGLLYIATDRSFTPLPVLVGFANELTATLGTT